VHSMFVCFSRRHCGLPIAKRLVEERRDLTPVVLMDVVTAAVVVAGLLKSRLPRARVASDHPMSSCARTVKMSGRFL
jgi:hypothetical protein